MSEINLKKRHIALSIPIIILVFYFFIYPKSYPIDTALSNGDTILYADGVYHQYNLLAFIDHANEKKQSEIVVTTYSKEGYPSIKRLKYDPKVGITCELDNTRNVYGRHLFIQKSVYDQIYIDTNKDLFLIDNNGKKLWIYQFTK